MKRFQRHESAQRLMNLIGDDSISSFIIKKGSLQVRVFRRGRQLVVSSDGANEMAPGYRAFKQSVERSIANEPITTLLSRLRQGIKSAENSQYRTLTNSL